MCIFLIHLHTLFIYNFYEFIDLSFYLLVIFNLFLLCLKYMDSIVSHTSLHIRSRLNMNNKVTTKQLFVRYHSEIKLLEFSNERF